MLGSQEIFGQDANDSHHINDYKDEAPLLISSIKENTYLCFDLLINSVQEINYEEYIP